MVDAFSKYHLEAYPDEALGSTESTMILACVPETARVETSLIECLMAYIQREAKLKSLHTQPEEFRRVLLT